MRHVLLAVVLMVTTSACRRAEGFREGEVISRPGQPNVSGVSAEDAAMNSAIAKARDSYPTFLRALDSPIDGAFYSLKAKFEDEGTIEHIWLVDPVRESGQVRAVVNNEPVFIKTLFLGDSVLIPPDRVSDWLIIYKGRYRGGFTIRYMRDGMTPEEQAKFDEEMGATPE